MCQSAGWPLLRTEGFFCNLDVLYGGLGIGTVIWGKTGRVKNFKVILKIFRKCFLEFFFHKKIHN
jgi:hypothetical protein